MQSNVRVEEVDPDQVIEEVIEGVEKLRGPQGDLSPIGPGVTGSNSGAIPDIFRGYPEWHRKNSGSKTEGGDPFMDTASSVDSEDALSVGMLLSRITELENHRDGMLDQIEALQGFCVELSRRLETLEGLRIP